jgi:copper chaperone CopZ
MPHPALQENHSAYYIAFSGSDLMVSSGKRAILPAIYSPLKIKIMKSYHNIHAAVKKLFLFTLFILTISSVNAQFSKATLQASGLTCAMCTKAINKSLEQLSFIESVKADIKNSAFNIVFKQGGKVDIDKLKKAVEEAGFSVARLKIAGNFNNLAIKNDEHVQLHGNTFHFLNVKNQTLNGVKEITLVDKNFLTSKEYKKYSAATQMKCVQTGKAAGCCSKEGIAANTRIYHVTI